MASYRTVLDRVGGALRSSQGSSSRTVDDHQISVCTISVAGFDEHDTKLELLLLQFMQDEDIDVLVCIDACCSTPLLHYPGTLQILRFLLGRGVLARYAGVRACILGCSAYYYVYLYGGVSVW